MSKECVEQVEGAGASVPMTDISNIDVPEGTDELSRSTRRAWRDRLNSASTRKMITGVLATLVGGSFWGFSGTSASFLFDTYHVDTLWLMSVRQILAGLLFMAVVVTRDRDRLVKLWTTPADRKQLLLFTAFGLLFNQFCYLSAVRLTNAGTATVLQCLQLVIIMGYTCVIDRRMPRTREVIGIGLALGGTFLIATGGDPTSLNISPLGLAAGLMCAVSAACMAVIPAKILPEYGSPIVTGSAMLTAGVVSCVFVQPWAHMPALDAAGIPAADYMEQPTRSRCLWSWARFWRTCSICRALRTSARCARASSELWSRFRRPSPAPLCWARCFCRPTLSALS